MPNGLETPALTVDPVILVVMLVAFLIGAVGPFALCVIGSFRDERAMRRYAAEGRSPAAVGNPVDPAMVPVTAPLQPAVPPAALDPANDDDDAPARAVRS